MADFLLHEWPTTSYQRGEQSKWFKFFDGQIYSILPSDYGQKTLNSLQGCIHRAARVRGIKIRCSRATKDGRLTVQALL